MTSPLSALATRIRRCAAQGEPSHGHPTVNVLEAIADGLDVISSSDKRPAERIIQALMAAGFDVRAASPLQHHAECGFWRDRPCGCAIQQLQDVVNSEERD